MKKIILLFVLMGLGFFFGRENAYAQIFQENIDKNNYYFISKENSSIYKYFNTFFDSNEKVYFNITPHIAFMPKQGYQEKTLSLSKEILEDLSKILYFGYGYQKNVSKDIYFATQYLIFERLMNEGYSIEVLDSTKSKRDDRLEEEISMIRKHLEAISFSLTDKTITEKKWVIQDDYILDNFLVSCDHAEVQVFEDKIEITFLEGEDFLVQFLPKNNCEEVKVWENKSWGTQLLAMEGVCEKEYSIAVHYEAPVVEDKKEEKPVSPSLQEKKDVFEEVEEAPTTESVREFEVPDTSQYSFLPIFFLCFLGNVYYVFKK